MGEGLLLGHAITNYALLPYLEKAQGDTPNVFPDKMEISWQSIIKEAVESTSKTSPVS